MRKLLIVILVIASFVCPTLYFYLLGAAGADSYLPIAVAGFIMHGIIVAALMYMIFNKGDKR